MMPQAVNGVQRTLAWGEYLRHVGGRKACLSAAQQLVVTIRAADLRAVSDVAFSVDPDTVLPDPPPRPTRATTRTPPS